ncbi:hypothetical protein CFC35_00370 [Streptomyces sp. FBKL.4005]|nr:hypothetical protein CFC35_00370 [Streptomyces sp. FBKL.4005]BCM64780.1 hypothetical protein EASAB2608_00114 [Streptomyces sp. EAS-AB2608]
MPKVSSRWAERPCTGIPSDCWRPTGPAGATVPAYLVPRVTAYAGVAGLPPVTGLWDVLSDDGDRGGPPADGSPQWRRATSGRGPPRSVTRR